MRARVVLIELSPAKGRGTADLVRVFAGAALVPAYAPEQPGADAVTTISAEQYVEPLGASRVADAKETPALASHLRASDRPARIFWCAVRAPFPGRDGPIEGHWLRFGLPPRPARPLRPIASLTADGESLRLTFAVDGAPLLPPSGKVAAAFFAPWVEAGRKAVQGVVRAATGGGHTARLLGIDVTDADRASLAAALDISEHRGVAANWCRAGAKPGPCVACRHANHFTADLTQDDLLHCKLGGRGAGIDQTCVVEVKTPTGMRYGYEPFDGGNCTWLWPGTPAPSAP